MNKNTTAVILIVLAVGIYFTFTSKQIAALKSIQAVNKEYQQAIDNSAKLIEVRESVLASYNSIPEADKERLNKLVPDNVDNVRLIIDVKDDIAARHNLFLKNIKTTSPEAQAAAGATQAARPDSNEKYGTVALSFSVTSGYEPFLQFLKDMEASLRLMDITKLTVKSNDDGTYDFNVELKTYWLKQT